MTIGIVAPTVGQFAKNVELLDRGSARMLPETGASVLVQVCVLATTPITLARHEWVCLQGGTRQGESGRLPRLLLVCGGTLPSVALI